MKSKGIRSVSKGSLTTPKGFIASGVHCGIKRSPKKYDLSLIVSETPAVAAGVFTVNRAKAWPVLISQKSILKKSHRAVFASSGNANCLNGKRGEKAALDCVAAVASELDVKKDEVLIAQTGLIGVTFPTTRAVRAVPQLVSELSKKGSHAAARGILTTDNLTKEAAVRFSIGGQTVTIGACAKGAGMIHPHMATMLSFITTDASVSKRTLNKALKVAVNKSFNQMSIDNDMSTNDTVFILANGQAKNKTISSSGKDFDLFVSALTKLLRALAREMILDGEGVGHLCHIHVKGAKSNKEAEVAVRQVANSMLFKTMLTGSDPNWGRIAAAVGSSGVSFNPDHLTLDFGTVRVVQDGKPRSLNRSKAKKVLSQKEYTVTIKIGSGKGEAEFMTSDLTKTYVDINADYS